jgi:hypothetical protein
MTNKQLAFGAVVVLALIALAFAAFSKVAVNTPVTQDQTQAFSGTPGSDFNSGDGCFSFQGVKTCHYRYAMRQSTTTPWSAKTPAATSTLAFFGCNFSTGSTTAKQIILAKGAAPQASTTVLGNNLLAANSQGAFYSTTTTLGDNVLAPNTSLNMSMIGGSGFDSPVGFCDAVVRLF